MIKWITRIRDRWSDIRFGFNLGFFTASLLFIALAIILWLLSVEPPIEPMSEP